MGIVTLSKFKLAQLPDYVSLPLMGIVTLGGVHDLSRINKVSLPLMGIVTWKLQIQDPNGVWVLITPHGDRNRPPSRSRTY